MMVEGLHGLLIDLCLCVLGGKWMELWKDEAQAKETQGMIERRE